MRRLMTHSGQDSAQEAAELAWFLDLLRREGVRRYLEIGALYGDTFWEIANGLPIGARAVALDKPSAPWGKPGTEGYLARCVGDLRAFGRDCHLILGDSADPAIVDQASRLGPYDAVLIDGDHSFDGCWRDWLAYGPMARIVAFHDIAWERGRNWIGSRIEVPDLWAGLKGRYRTEEKIVRWGDCGIGVLFQEGGDT